MKPLLAAVLALCILWSGMAYSQPIISQGGGGVQTDTNCDQAKYYPIGILCQDKDDGKLYKGTGAAVSEITAGVGIAADGSVPFTGAPVPNAANTIALGSATAEWADIYLGDGGIIYGQNDQSNTLTSSATGWTAALKFTAPELVSTGANGITAQGAGGLIAGVASTTSGKVDIYNSASAFPFTFAAGNVGAPAIGWTMPTAVPGGNYLVSITAATQAIGYTNPATLNVGSATALAADPTDCAAGQVATGIAASGNLSCTATPSLQALTLTGANTLALGTSRTNNGSIIFSSGTALNDFLFTVQASNFGANLTWTLPTAAPGGANYLLNVDADGTMGYTDPASLGGGAMATDTLWDAKGDLAVGTGANTGGKLSVGADKTILRVATDTPGYSTATMDDSTLNALTITNGTGSMGFGAGKVFKVTGTLTNGKLCSWATGGDVSCNTDATGTGDVTAASNTQTWGAGDAATVVWTFNNTGTDPTLTASTGAIAVGGKLSATTYGSDGSVSDAELLYIGGLTSDAQTQLNAKATTANWGGSAASPPALGTGTPAAATFTTISAGAAGFSVDATGNVTAASLTMAASATPTSTFLDSDAPGADKEIAKVVGAYIDGADGSENGTLSLYAHEAGTTTEYIKADGKNARISMLKPTLMTSPRITTNIADANASPMIGFSPVAGGSGATYINFGNAKGAGVTVPITVISDQTNANLSMNAKAAGTIDIGGTSSGGVNLAAGGGNVSATGTLTVTTDLLLTSATAGARLTGGNGLLTIKGEGDGTDEDLTINLNSSNVATVSSSTGVATVDFSAINLVTSGTIQGKLNVITDDITLAASQCYGSVIVMSGGAETATLPAAIKGMNVLFYASGAGVKNIDPNGTETITLTTAALAAGYQIESPGAVGDFIALVSLADGTWTAMGRSGTWVTHGAD